MKEIRIPAGLIKAYADSPHHTCLPLADLYKFDGVLTRLDKALDESQKRSRERTIGYIDILSALYDIEQTLHIPKRALEGVSVDVDPNAQAFPSAYRYTPYSTHFRAEFRGGCWRITSIERSRCSPGVCGVRHTEASAKAIIDRFTILY